MKRPKRKNSNRQPLPAAAVLLAGGRGTRFWPRSRVRTPKQLLNITGAETMLRETAARLEPLIPSRDLWVVTNVEQAAAVRRQLRGLPASHVLAEPVGRNTAAAIGLAAIHLAHQRVDAVMAVLPSDHDILEAKRYRGLVSAALELACTPGNLVVLGISPTHPETGFGYIESAKIRRFGQILLECRHVLLACLDVSRRAAAVSVGDARGARRARQDDRHTAVLLCARSHLSAPRKYLGRIRDHGAGHASRKLVAGLRDSDEGRWSDLGSWAAIYELLAAKRGANVSAGSHFALDAEGNYFWSPRKFVAAIGVRDLVLVETDDALLVCAREHSQDVGKIVKWLDEQKAKQLL